MIRASAPETKTAAGAKNRLAQGHGLVPPELPTQNVPALRDSLTTRGCGLLIGWARDPPCSTARPTLALGAQRSTVSGRVDRVGWTGERLDTLPVRETGACLGRQTLGCPGSPREHRSSKSVLSSPEDAPSFPSESRLLQALLEPLAWAQCRARRWEEVQDQAPRRPHQRRAEASTSSAEGPR